MFTIQVSNEYSTTYISLDNVMLVGMLLHSMPLTYTGPWDGGNSVPGAQPRYNQDNRVSSVAIRVLRLEIDFESNVLIPQALGFQLVADWTGRLSAFGQLSELEVIRLVCKENADMGSPIVSKRKSSVITNPPTSSRCHKLS